MWPFFSIYWTGYVASLTQLFCAHSSCQSERLASQATGLADTLKRSNVQLRSLPARTPLLSEQTKALKLTTKRRQQPSQADKKHVWLVSPPASSSTRS